MRCGSASSTCSTPAPSRYSTPAAFACSATWRFIEVRSTWNVGISLLNAPGFFSSGVSESRSSWQSAIVFGGGAVARQHEKVEAELAIGVRLEPIAEPELVAQKDARAFGERLADDDLLLLAPRPRLEDHARQAATLQHQRRHRADQPAANHRHVVRRIHGLPCSNASFVAMRAESATIGSPAPGWTLPPQK